MPRKTKKTGAASPMRVSCVRPGVLAELDQDESPSVTEWLAPRLSRLAFTPEQVVAAAVSAYDLRGPLTDGVYFLVRNGRVCYVGQARCVITRLEQHMRTGRRFDCVSVIVGLQRDAVNDVESAYRDGWEPPWNMANVPWYSQESRKLMESLRRMDLSLVCTKPEFAPFTDAEIDRLTAKMDGMFDGLT